MKDCATFLLIGVLLVVIAIIWHYVRFMFRKPTSVKQTVNKDGHNVFEIDFDKKEDR
jgi:hypothetical protein